MEPPDFKSEVKDQLDAVVTFMSTSAYRSYVHTHNVDIVGTKESILSCRPTTPGSVYQLSELYGKLDQLESALKFFEEARATLESKLDEIVESEKQTPGNTKT